jgi:hypothetical protein
MFKDKGGKTIESKPTIEIKVINTLINMVDVNVTTWNNTSEEQVFKDQELRKIKSMIGWEAEEKLKKSMVETIQQM